MQNTWSHLLLIFGLAAPLVPASLLQTAAMNFSSPTTLVNIPSTNTTTTQPLSNGDLQTAAMNLSSPTSLVTIPATNTTIQPLSDGNLMQTAAMNFSSPTTLVTIPSTNATTIQPLSDGDLMHTVPLSANSAAMTSADATATQIPEGLESVFDPFPTVSPTLSVVSNWQAPTPTPGSIAIINGIATRVLNDTIQQAEPILADTVNADEVEGIDLYQPWNTSYPGPIHDGDWNKYLQIWDPIWWSRNLDSLRQTACTCSGEDFLTNPDAQLAAYINFQYFSHQSATVYSLDWLCGPAPSSMSISERLTSAKHKAEHCWQAAGGEFAGDAFAGDRLKPEKIKGYYCDAKEELCVEPWRARKRSLTFHGHKRFYDREGVHTWSEIESVVTDVCEPICRNMFNMQFNDWSHHNPSFLTTFYPPKPIDLDIVGD